MGKVLANILICFFTEYNDLQDFISSGAKFQSLIPSFRNIAFLSSVQLSIQALKHSLYSEI